MESNVPNFAAKRRSISAFKLSLDYLKNQDDVEFMNISDIANKYPSVTKNLLIQNNRYSSLQLPGLFLPLYIFSPRAMIPPGTIYYLKADKAISLKKTVKLKVYFINAISFVSFLMVGFLIFRFLIWRIIVRKLLKISVYRVASVFLFALAMLYSVRNGGLGFMAGIAVALFIGLLAGELLFFKYDIKKVDS